MIIGIKIDGMTVTDRLEAVRYLTGIPELNQGCPSNRGSVDVGTVFEDPSHIQHGQFQHGMIIQISPRRMSYGSMQPPQIATSGMFRGLIAAEEYGRAYAEAVALAREAADLAAIYEQERAAAEEELRAKEKAAIAISHPLHPLGTDLSEPTP